MSFDKLNSIMLTAWQSKLLSDRKRKLSAKTVRECRGVLSIILSEARQEGLLTNDLFEGVKKLPRHQKEVRGILTETEVRKLFDKTIMNSTGKTIISTIMPLS